MTPTSLITPPETALRLGIIAGEGELPVQVAKNAKDSGWDVVAFSLSKDNRSHLHKACNGQSHVIVPGLVNRTLALLKQEKITQLVFAGKVNKWILFRDPRMDERALHLLRTQLKRNDDSIMWRLIDELDREGIQVVQQTDFLHDLFLSPGVLSNRQPDSNDWRDIAYGYNLAWEMGRLDVGQTVVVRDGMVLAVEAIEGTDECLKRAGHWARRKGGVVVKVAKPAQDQRFDVPTVGLRTLKTMKKAGLHVLAAEANRTLFLDLPAMQAFANQNNMTLVSFHPDDVREHADV